MKYYYISLFLLCISAILSECSTSKPITTITPAVSSKPVVSKGEELYDNKCGRCHRLYPVSAFTQREWDEIMLDMAVKSKLSDDETIAINDYLKKACKNCAQ